MPRTRPPDDDEFDDLPDGVYHDDDLPTVPCPYCREPVLEDVGRCPACESYISAEDAPPARKPTWVWVCLILALLASVLAAFL